MTKKSDDLGSSEVQKKVDTETEQGFSGTVPDQTPNQNYTVGGVLKDKPTPETSTPEKK
jgi:hypothetical protein